MQHTINAVWLHVPRRCLGYVLCLLDPTAIYGRRHGSLARLLNLPPRRPIAINLVIPHLQALIEIRGVLYGDP
jgi:hypothetical protein